MILITQVHHLRYTDFNDLLGTLIIREQSGVHYCALEVIKLRSIPPGISNCISCRMDNCWGSEIFGLEFNDGCNNDYDRVTGMNSGEGQTSSFDPEFNLIW